MNPKDLTSDCGQLHKLYTELRGKFKHVETEIERLKLLHSMIEQDLSVVLAKMEKEDCIRGKQREVVSLEQDKLLQQSLSKIEKEKCL